MNRIGILTYHHVANWGSALQAYCLYVLLKRMYPRAAIELIDYVPETSFEYSRKRVKPRKTRLPLLRRRRSTAYELKLSACTEFLSQFCVLSTPRLCSDSLALGREYLANLDYDAVFVGSDTVFQLGADFGGTYISAPQAPNLYFLPFEASYQKIAFAASANPFTPSMLESLDIETTANALMGFDVITYRDEATRHALHALGVAEQSMRFMPDPTLLVDFDSLADGGAADAGGSNIAAVAIGNRKLAGAVMERLTNLGYVPLDLLTGHRSAITAAAAATTSVVEYLGSFRQYRLVVTDRFHGSIISMVVGDCPVVGVEEAERYPEPNSKLRDLFERLDIEDMIYRCNPECLETGWIAEYVNRWAVTKPQLMERVCKMRMQAYSDLQIICGSASGSHNLTRVSS